MPKSESQAQKGLCCDECKLGYSECQCVPRWISDDKKKARDAEIRAIKGAVMRNTAYKAEIKPEPRQGLALSLPDSLVRTLKARSKIRRQSVSKCVEELLRAHSGDGTRLMSVGINQRLKVSLSRSLVKRIKIRAKIEKSTASQIVREHLEKELYSEGKVE